MNANLNITLLQRELFNKLVTLNLSDNIFLKRPRAIAGNLSDYIVSRVSTNIYDWTAYGEAIVSLDIYVRDLKDGVTMNVDKFESINSALLNNLPFVTANYQFSYLNATPTVDDGSGFTFQIINIKVIINN